MQKLTVSEIVIATCGKLIQGQENTEITHVTRDSREAAKGSLFVPLKGENNDGHDFIENAASAGASAIITQRRCSEKVKSAVIEVEDTLKALGDIARFYKEKYNVPTVSVTGSVGKTTTKDIIYSALAAVMNTHKTLKNYNNDIGVPETVFGIEKEHEAAVIEMGMNHAGEIDYLASIVKPDIAVITNIGMSHIENLGSREGIFNAKMEIANRFNEHNTLILNGDDDFLGTVKNKKYKVVHYGIKNPDNDIRAYDIENHGLSGTVFKTVVDGREYTVTVPVAGEHNVYNALSAICAAKEMGADMEKAIAGIANVRLTENRFETVDVRGMKIIKDYYNASPASVRASLGTLSCFDGRHVAILGDILEMGDFAAEEHYKLGEAVIENGVGLLITAGENAALIAKCAKERGMENVFSFKTPEEAGEFSKTALKEGDNVLIKASHGMNFGKIFDAISKK